MLCLCKQHCPQRRPCLRSWFFILFSPFSVCLIFIKRVCKGTSKGMGQSSGVPERQHGKGSVYNDAAIKKHWNGMVWRLHE